MIESTSETVQKELQERLLANRVKEKRFAGRTGWVVKESGSFTDVIKRYLKEKLKNQGKEDVVDAAIHRYIDSNEYLKISILNLDKKDSSIGQNLMDRRAKAYTDSKRMRNFFLISLGLLFLSAAIFALLSLSIKILAFLSPWVMVGMAVFFALLTITAYILLSNHRIKLRVNEQEKDLTTNEQALIQNVNNALIEIHTKISRETAVKRVVQSTLDSVLKNSIKEQGALLTDVLAITLVKALKKEQLFSEKESLDWDTFVSLFANVEAESLGAEPDFKEKIISTITDALLEGHLICLPPTIEELKARAKKQASSDAQAQQAILSTGSGVQPVLPHTTQRPETTQTAPAVNHYFHNNNSSFAFNPASSTREPSTAMVQMEPIKQTNNSSGLNVDSAVTLKHSLNFDFSNKDAPTDPLIKVEMVSLKQGKPS